MYGTWENAIYEYSRLTEAESRNSCESRNAVKLGYGKNTGRKLRNPRPGGYIAEARDYGIDLRN